MKDDFENVYDMVEHAIEYAFEGRCNLSSMITLSIVRLERQR